MFPTIVGAWVLDEGGAGRRRFCYPKGQEPRRCTGWRMLGFRSWMSSARMELGWAREEMGMGMEMEMGDRNREGRHQALSKAECVAAEPWVPWALVAGSCWLLT